MAKRLKHRRTTRVVASIVLVGCAGFAAAQGAEVTVAIDLEAAGFEISPAIYGVSFADAEQLASVMRTR